MKKKISIISISILILLIIFVFIFINKKTKIETLKYEEEDYGYNVYVDVPKGKEYQFKKNNEEDIDADYILIGEKIKMLFYNEAYNYRNTLRYIKKYNNKEVNFTNWKEYIKDTDFSDITTLDLIETTINNREVVRYNYYDDKQNNEKINGYIYVFNIDDINTKRNLTIKIFPTDENYEIQKLIEEKEIKKIINSIKLEK